MYTMTSTRTYPVILAYICSHCGQPVLNVTTIHASTSMPYRFFSERKAALSVEETTERLVSNMTEQLRKHKQPFPHSTRSCIPPHTDDPCESRHIFLSGYDAPCPHCGNQESWQTVSPSDGHTPTVFFSESAASAWLHHANSNAPTHTPISLPAPTAETYATEYFLNVECFRYAYHTQKPGLNISSYFHAKWDYSRWWGRLWAMVATAVFCALELSNFFVKGKILHLVLSLLALFLCLRTSYFHLTACTTEQNRHSCNKIIIWLLALAIFVLGLMIGLGL